MSINRGISEASRQPRSTDISVNLREWRDARVKWSVNELRTLNPQFLAFCEQSKSAIYKAKYSRPEDP